ncbi:hypothetical protein LOTGIDRAFT_237550 [Lottia gigantea]|uniref:Uncharacterized protein n=1 Tax=Lottia gigantea TaxID=225164 RepID=V4CNZ6_LOTGI|nr:hypothetical protein LOTGIDRAFT_237550 [Lottia gigantea]ESP04135.1 hypothetical protein LOTGIDRAFT_237550 [Lottia gigantea]
MGDIKISIEKPFKKAWINSCYQQTLLPGSPWHKLEAKLARELANRVEKQFDHLERKEMLLDLLGNQFVQEFLPNVQRNPTLLEPPNLSYESRQLLYVEAQGWLNSQMYKTVRELGYQNMLNGNSSEDEPPSDFTDFLQHTFSVFNDGLDRELFIQEKDLAAKKKHQLDRDKRRNENKFIPKPSRYKPVSSASLDTNTSSKPSSSQIKAMVQRVEGDPPPLWGKQSDEVGDSVLAILQHDPRKFEHVAGRLHGRQLPGQLRSYMWADILLKMERKKLKDVNAEKYVRERFGRAVSRGLTDLHVQRATQSPINGLIQNAVIETYSKTTSMVAYKGMNHLKETARVLNILYVYDRSYEPYLIHWLFPLQIAFRGKSDTVIDRTGHAMDLSMYLDLLNTNCFPKWPEVFAIAEQVMSVLQKSDPELYNHLRTISRINVQFNPKEFLVQMIHEEKAKAEAILKATDPGASRDESMSTELLADPIIFIRRWIGEGFVSVLDTPGVMYVWDQCFMQGWTHTVLQNTCLSLLQLLRHKFMTVEDYMGMKEVFLIEPCKLYTADVQASWIHLEIGKPLTEVQYLNRQRPSSPSGTRSPSVHPASPFPGILQPCGIKGVRIKLIIPLEIVQREPWLLNVKAENLKLHSAIYFGSIRLRSRMNLTPAKVNRTSRDNFGNSIYQLSYPQEKFVYEALDLLEYDVERELGASPYAILRLEYDSVQQSQQGKAPISVGWARVPLFKRGSRGGGRVSTDSSWSLVLGDTSFTLHPGQIPDSLVSSSHPITPSLPSFSTDKDEADVLIGYNSELSAVVYDPRNEPQSASPDPFTSTDNITTPVPPHDTRKQSPRKPEPRKLLTPESDPVVNLPPRRPDPVLPPAAVHQPKQHPTQKPEPIIKPTAQPTPTPQPTLSRTSLREEFKPWVEHQPLAAADNPSPISVKDAFDLYIDQVRYIPDNASIVKVTGRVLQTGDIDKLNDIAAIPNLDMSARCPVFDYRLCINSSNKQARQDMLVLLRCYTVDIVQETLCVVGNCLVPLFDQNGKLLVGGHQLRLREGLPVQNDKLKASDLDQHIAIPSTSILIRLLPHTKNPIPAPKYSLGYYLSEQCRPNDSEKKIYTSYGIHRAYPQTEREMIKRLQQTEKVKTGQSDRSLRDWLIERLDIKKQLSSNEKPQSLSLTRCVRYRVKQGLNIKINQAFGLKGDYYVHCFARIAPGRKVLGMEPTTEGFGKESKFITLKHDNESYLMSPVWTSQPEGLHPFYDPYSCLIIQIFGLKLKYKAESSHSKPGVVTGMKGEKLNLDMENIIGWSVVPIFEGNSVLTGTHYVPIFKGNPTEEILTEITKNSANLVLRSQTIPKEKYDSASLAVTMWDAHYEFNEIPEFNDYEHLLEAVGNINDYTAVRKKQTGKRYCDFVLDSLPQKLKKQGTKGSIYQKEQGFFDSIMSKTFYDLVESALMTAGFGPL